MSSNYQNAIIGQPKLCQVIAKSTLDNLPQSIMLIGPQGCGKHLVCHHLAAHLGLELEEVSSKMTDEKIFDILSYPHPCLYIFNVDGFLPKVQNSLLKLIEEPIAGVHIAVIATSLTKVLPTLSNRCIKWTFEPYQKEDLRSFIDSHCTAKDLALNVAQTPGQALLYSTQNLEAAGNLADNMVTRIHQASLANVLSIGDKVAFRGEVTGIELGLLLTMLRLRLIDAIEESESLRYQRMYEVLNSYYKKFDFCISKARVFDGLLIDLWEAAQE